MSQEKYPVKTPQQYILEDEDLINNAETRAPITVCVD